MQCDGKGDLLERFGPYTRVAVGRDPEVCVRDVEWHRDVLAALPEEQGAHCAVSGELRCCVCGTGSIAGPAVAALRCGGDAEGLVAALESTAAGLRRGLEGLRDAEGAGHIREWAEEALQTLGCAEAGIGALRENRCATWDAAERTLAAAVARVQQVQRMLS